MYLRYSQTSPFVRKVMIVAIETGLGGGLRLEKTNAWAPDTDLPRDNPLCKVPALVTDGGEHLYDSPVICEYLDSLHDGAKLFPAAGGARWTALRRQALADGIMDAAVAVRVETVTRPDAYRWDAWAERQRVAIRRGVDAREEEADSLDQRFSIGEIAIACALGYLEFRHAIDDWRHNHPALSAWYDRIAQRPSVVATIPKD